MRLGVGEIDIPDRCEDIFFGRGMELLVIIVLM
jgi:hypothetical protein